VTFHGVLDTLNVEYPARKGNCQDPDRCVGSSLTSPNWQFRILHLNPPGFLGLGVERPGDRALFSHRTGAYLSFQSHSLRSSSEIMIKIVRVLQLRRSSNRCWVGALRWREVTGYRLWWRYAHEGEHVSIYSHPDHQRCIVHPRIATINLG